MVRYLAQKEDFEFRKYIDRENLHQKDHIENLLGVEKTIFLKTIFHT